MYQKRQQHNYLRSQAHSLLTIVPNEESLFILFFYIKRLLYYSKFRCAEPDHDVITNKTKTPKKIPSSYIAKKSAVSFCPRKYMIA